MNRMARAMLKAALSVAVAGLAAQAETLYDKDGVQFEGTIRLVTSGAGRCNVLEEKYSEQEYEKLKANQDQPLNLWRVDFLIRNGSGRVIDYLNASSWVNAEYPPCTNWSGPEMAPLDSSVWVAWGDHLVPMQKPSGMRAGQEERHAVYLMVFHEHRPTFGEWNIDYDFAKEAASGKEPAAGASRMPVSGGAMAAPAARRVESRAPQPPRQAGQGRPSGISAEQTCAGKPQGAACWMELANQTGCYVWNDYLAADETAAWPGECSGGVAQGTGTLTWVWDRGQKTNESTGRLRDGKPHGDWVTRFAKGGGSEGPYVDGKKHGRWVERDANGNVAEGPYVDGKPQGDWVMRFAKGGVNEGPFVDGKMHGRWVTRGADGFVQEGPYVDGKKHGRWVTRGADGDVEEGPYVDGKKHGRWVFRLADGGVQEGPYVDGKMHGRWVLRQADGGVQEGSYVDGKKHGRWVLRWADGDVWEGPYVDGKKHGHWVERWLSGTVEEGPYVDGKMHGDWVVRWPDGAIWEGPYVDDEKHGRWVTRSASGTVKEGPYVDGKMHGDWVVRWPDGAIWEGPYVDDEKHGRWVTRSASGTVKESIYVNGELQ